MFGIALSLFFSIFISSCHGKPKPDDLTLNPVYKQQMSNFTFLVKEAEMTICDEEDNKAGECESITVPQSSASGVVITSSTSHIFVLTANHFCEDLPESIPDFGPVKNTIQVHIGTSKREASVIAYDKKNDLCLLEALKTKKENFKTIKIAQKMPRVGDKLYNFAAPNGIGSPNTRLMFDGYFSGCEIDMCMYTIPATFGSSGSAVYNQRGELVSILVAAAIDFENVSMGPSNQKIIDFIKSVSDVVDIY